MDRYTAEVFSMQLKKARLYRAYKSQSRLAGELKIAKQVYSLWEGGKRLPTLKQFAAIARTLKMKVDYFFIIGAEPSDYELFDKKFDTGKKIDGQ